MEKSQRVVISIVSHGHGEMLPRLLAQIASIENSGVVRVVVTYNIPEENHIKPLKSWNFNVDYIYNKYPLGYGSNHNNALVGAKEDFVCIINPDVELVSGDNPFNIINYEYNKNIGCIYPVQIDENNKIQDSERELLTPWALFRRRVLRKNQRSIDWINGAFLLIPTSRWKSIEGFDTRYFMYCEDVDLSLRLQLQGGDLIRNDVQVVHAGQRASSRKWRHLLWHVQSLLRLWTSCSFWSYLIKHR